MSSTAAPFASPDASPVLRRILGLLAPHRRRITVIMALVVGSALLTAVTPFLIRAVFDRALFPADGRARWGLLGGLVAGLIGVAVITALIGVAQNWLTALVGNSAMADVRGQLFRRLQTMELAFFTATKTGSIQSRLANDVNGVRSVLTDTISTILQNLVTVLAAFVSMVIMSWPLTILTLGVMPVFVWLQVVVGRRRQRLARRTQESLAEMTVITEEALSVSGILLAKAFGRSADEVERYRRANAEQTVLQVEKAMIGRTFFAVVQTFFAITPALLFLAAGWLLGRGTPLTAGTLVAFTTLQTKLQKPMVQLMRKALDVHVSLALFRRIFEYLDLRPAIRDAPHAVALPSSEARGEVTLDHVWFRYPTVGAEPGDEPTDPVWALRDVTLTVRPGQFAAIVGPSGSGKTTTAYLLPRLHEVSAGAVRIDGHDVRDLTLASVADTVGLVTQEPYLFHGSIADNIGYADPRADQEAIERAARAAEIHDRICTFPEGYATVVGERGYRLSGGERQRLAIARVLLADPQVLVLDEATSALDSHTERLVQRALERAAKGRTTIAIAHRLSTVRNADVIFGLRDGALVEQGSHDELVAAGGLYGGLWQQQLDEVRPAHADDQPADDIPAIPRRAAAWGRSRHLSASARLVG